MQVTNAPAYSRDEAEQHETFHTLMDAMSFPGRIFSLPAGNPFMLIANTLFDLETSWCTPDESLAAALRQTGARELPPSVAAYHLYPDAVDLDAVEAADMGDMLYPDSSATLIVACAFDGASYELTGPGIQSAAKITLNLSSEFWALRSRATYPLGWDAYFVDGQRIIGIPRSTIVRAIVPEPR